MGSATAGVAPRHGQLERTKAVVQVLAAIDEWTNARQATGGTLNELMDALLDRLDWDLVDVDAVKEAVRTLLAGAPDSETAGLCAIAARERAALARSVRELAAENAATGGA